ncbi:MAG: hypothetical protein KJ053_09965 [Dehalococcoidia bacterium]|nr:hypothetical protein [Dehalococcoidia bacterium]
MTFSISFSDKLVPVEPAPGDEIPKMYIVLLIDEEITTFVAPVNYWSMAQYTRQWKDGLARLERHSSSCLLTGARDPSLRQGVTMVELHKEGTDVFARERYVFADRVPDDYDPCEPYELIGPHPVVHRDADGSVREIRGTRVPLADIEAFKRTLESA